MKLYAQQALFALHVSQLISWISHQGYLVTFGEAMRSHEQAVIYAQQGKGIKKSLHCERLALDINVFDHNGKYLSDTKDYESFGKYWESLDHHNRWGGRFKRRDGNHFQRDEEPT